MNDRDRIDLSPLDPMQDPEHWRAVVAATLTRVDAVLPRSADDPFVMIAAWSRPLLIAASLALVVLVPVEFALERRDDRVEQVERLVSLSAGWDHGEVPPSAEQFLRALRPEPAR